MNGYHCLFYCERGLHVSRVSEGLPGRRDIYPILIRLILDIGMDLALGAVGLSMADGSSIPTGFLKE
jgi:hypothetical protein